jgi:hypothetical protein
VTHLHVGHYRVFAALNSSGTKRIQEQPARMEGISLIELTLRANMKSTRATFRRWRRGYLNCKRAVQTLSAAAAAWRAKDETRSLLATVPKPIPHCPRPCASCWPYPNQAPRDRFERGSSFLASTRSLNELISGVLWSTFSAGVSTGGARATLFCGSCWLEPRAPRTDSQAHTTTGEKPGHVAIVDSWRKHTLMRGAATRGIIRASATHREWLRWAAALQRRTFRWYQTPPTPTRSTHRPSIHAPRTHPARHSTPAAANAGSVHHGRTVRRECRWVRQLNAARAVAQGALPIGAKSVACAHGLLPHADADPIRCS